MASTKAGKYIGDAAVAKMLTHYKSTTPFHVVRMRVLGALASPNKELLPVMVMASFWPEEQFPKFERKDEAESFFSAFMGLWRRTEKMVVGEAKLLSARGKLATLDEVKALLLKRMEEVDAGFIEGFWGGMADMKMSSASAALIDGLGEEAEAYYALMEDIETWESYTATMREAVNEEIQERDRVVEDAIKALLLLKDKESKTEH